MDVEKLSHYGSRTFFVAALILFVAAVVEWILSVAGLVTALGYKPGRLVEFAAMFMVPVITVLLRQIRDELRKHKSA
jgi:hypothetical protein